MTLSPVDGREFGRGTNFMGIQRILWLFWQNCQVGSTSCGFNFFLKCRFHPFFNRNYKSKNSRLRKKLGEWHPGCWGFTRISGCLSGRFAPVPTNSMLTDLNVNPNVNPVIHNTLCRLDVIPLMRKEKFCVDLSDYLLHIMECSMVGKLYDMGA